MSGDRKKEVQRKTGGRPWVEELLTVDRGCGYYHVRQYPWSRESVIQRRESPAARIGAAVAYVHWPEGHVQWMGRESCHVWDAITRFASKASGR